MSLPRHPDLSDDVYTAIGFPVFGDRALRADIAETVGERLAHGAPGREIAMRLGCGIDELPSLRRATLCQVPAASST